MSTKNAQPVPPQTPTLTDNTAPEANGYFNGQLIVLKPTINANGGYTSSDYAKYGSQLAVQPDTGQPGLSQVPGVDYQQDIPKVFPSSGTWTPTWGPNKDPGQPMVIRGEHKVTPLWFATTKVGSPPPTSPLSMNPALETNGQVPQNAHGLSTLVSTTILTGVTTVQPPKGGNADNQVRIQLPMLGPDGSTQVPPGSGPFVGAFYVRSSSKDFDMGSLAFYDTEVDNDAPVPAPFVGQDRGQDSVWPRSDADGNFDMYIVPNSGTDKTDGWIELYFTAGGTQSVQSAFIILAPQKGIDQDTNLGAPSIAESSGAYIDLSIIANFHVTLPQYVLNNIETGTRAFMMLNDQPITTSMVTLVNRMDAKTPIFLLQGSDSRLKITQTVGKPPQNILQYVLVDPSGLRTSVEYPFYAIKSTGELAPPGPPQPAGDTGWVAPTIRELKGQVLTGIDIAGAQGVHVVASWTNQLWQPVAGQSIQVNIWLSGYHHGGETKNQNTLIKTVPVNDPTATSMVVPFTPDQFADYGPPAFDANELPTMLVQFYVLDTDKVTVLHTSPTLYAYLDTLPAGD